MYLTKRTFLLMHSSTLQKTNLPLFRQSKFLSHPEVAEIVLLSISMFNELVVLFAIDLLNISVNLNSQARV